MPDRDDNFLARWSRRKLEARRTGADEVGPPETGTSGELPTERADLQTRDEIASTPAADASSTPAPVVDDFSDVDFSKLDATSDYTRFMRKGVPDDIRNKALAKLWTSDPVLAKPEELIDYADDYTDAAVAVRGGLLRTAYKVGQGFLTDEEAAQWENLGKPTAPASTVAEPVVLLPGFVVRAGSPADSQGLLDVHMAAVMGAGAQSYGEEIAKSWIANLTVESYSSAMQNEEFEVALEQATGRVVAFCSIRADEVCGLYVHPSFGHRGLAAALLARAEKKIASGGHSAIRLTASLPGLAFYQRHGYSRIREWDKPTRGGLAMRVVDMHKQISA